MTRDEFNANFAARMDNTEGYTQGQLDAINCLAFEQVSDLDLDHGATWAIVNFALERASVHYDVATAK
jgi:hypothetical protein